MRIIKLFLLISVVSLTLISCQKEDSSKITSSTIISTGETPSEDIVTTEKADDKTGVVSTRLSYKSWLDLDVVRTRAAEVVEVELYAESSTEVESMQAFDYVLTEPVLESVEHICISSEEHDKNPYLRIIDSAVVFKVNHGTFVMDHKFIYQVAEYNDGHTKTVLPYKTFDESSFIVNPETREISMMDCKMVDGETYAQRRFNSDVSIEFDGVEMEAKQAAIPYVSIAYNGEVGVYHVEMLATEIGYAQDSSGLVVATIIVKEYLSDGTTRNRDYNYGQYVYMNSENQFDVKGAEILVGYPHNLNPSISISNEEEVEPFCNGYDYELSYAYSQAYYRVKMSYLTTHFGADLTAEYGKRILKTISFYEPFQSITISEAFLAAPIWKETEHFTGKTFIEYTQYVHVKTGSIGDVNFSARYPLHWGYTYW